MLVSQSGPVIISLTIIKLRDVDRRLIVSESYFLPFVSPLFSTHLISQHFFGRIPIALCCWEDYTFILIFNFTFLLYKIHFLNRDGGQHRSSSLPPPPPSWLKLATFWLTVSPWYHGPVTPWAWFVALSNPELVCCVKLIGNSWSKQSTVGPIFQHAPPSAKLSTSK